MGCEARRRLTACAVGLVALQLLVAHPARATENVAAGWRLELWPEQRWASPGGSITYHLEATRLDTPVVGATVFASIGQQWTLPLIATGQTWSTTFDVAVSPSEPLGNRKTYWAAVSGGTAPSLKDEARGEGTPSPPHNSVDSSVYVFLMGFNSTFGSGLGSFSAADPVSTATGERHLFPAPDIDLGGPSQLAVNRYYASRLADEGLVASGLGSNWMHNFDVRLTEKGFDYRVVTYHGGKQIDFQMQFTQPGTAWGLNFRQEPIRYQLKQDGLGHYWLVDPAAPCLYQFDAVGDLQMVLDRNENRQIVDHAIAPRRVNRVSDDLGRVLTFTYDPAGRLTRVSDGTRNVNFTYDANGFLASASDPLGNTVAYSYDAALTHGALLTAVTQPRGNVPYTHTYDAAGRVISESDAYGNITTFAYDTPAAGSTSITAPDASSRVHTHLDDRLGTGIADEAGTTLALTYDDRERATSLRDRNERTAAVTFDPVSGRIASYTDAAGKTTSYTYTAQQQTFTNRWDPTKTVSFTFYNLTGVALPDGTTLTYEYDAHGNQVAFTNGAGETWRWERNARGQITRAINPAGGVATYTYNPDGTIATSVDPDTGAVAYRYDAFKRMVGVTWPDASATAIAYDANDRITASTNERGKTTTFTYDANGYPATMTGPLGEQMRFSRDLMNRPATETDPLGFVESFAYNTRGLLSQVTDRNLNVTTYAYDARGLLTTVTNPGGGVWRFAYDRDGVPVSRTTPLGLVTTLERDALGRTVAITDPASGVTRFRYDAMGRTIAVTDRMERERTFGWDGAGRLISASDPPLGTANYVRNVLGFPTQVNDLRGQPWTYAYTTGGRLSSQRAPVGSAQSFAYDPRGALARITHPDGGVTDLTRDTTGRLVQLAATGATAIPYTHDDSGRLLTTTALALTHDARGDVTSSQDGPAVFISTYDPGRRLRTLDYSGQMTVTYSYDARNLLTRVEDTRTGAWINFTYDADGRLGGMTRSNGVSTTLTRDGAGRLTRIQDGTLADQRFTLNAEGEVTRVDGERPLETSPAGTLATLTFDAASQVSSPGYAYNARGSRTAGPGATFGWNGFGRVDSVSAAGGAASFTYNGLGDLRTRTEGASTTTYDHGYALPGTPIIAERVGATHTRFYVYSPMGALLYSVAPAASEVRFYHGDHLGSTLFLTDGTGAVTDAYAYSAYGDLTGHTGSSDQPFTFVGRLGVRRESVGGLYDMRARMFDPATAAFLSRDPVHPVLALPRALNPYGYAFQSPLRYVDPQGMMPAWGQYPPLPGWNGGLGGGTVCTGEVNCYTQDDGSVKFSLNPYSPSNLENLFPESQAPDPTQPNGDYEKMNLSYTQHQEPVYAGAWGFGTAPESENGLLAGFAFAGAWAPEQNAGVVSNANMIGTPNLGFFGNSTWVFVKDVNVGFAEKILLGPLGNAQVVAGGGQNGVYGTTLVNGPFGTGTSTIMAATFTTPAAYVDAQVFLPGNTSVGSWVRITPTSSSSVGEFYVVTQFPGGLAGTGLELTSLTEGNIVILGQKK